MSFQRIWNRPYMLEWDNFKIAFQQLIFLAIHVFCLKEISIVNSRNEKIIGWIQIGLAIILIGSGAYSIIKAQAFALRIVGMKIKKWYLYVQSALRNYRHKLPSYRKLTVRRSYRDSPVL